MLFRSHRWKEVTAIGTLLGAPTLAMPAGFGSSGLPIGLQVIGRNHDDAGVIELAAAWERGDIDAAFVWDPVLAKIKASGKQIISSGQIAQDTGLATFDGIVANKTWAAANADFMVKFLSVIAKADADYSANKAKWSVGSPQVKAVAAVTGATEADVPAAMALYHFIPPAEQASATWLGGGAKGGAAKSLAATAAFLKSQGTIASVLPDYSAGINVGYAAKASAKP